MSFWRESCTEGPLETSRNFRTAEIVKSEGDLHPVTARRQACAEPLYLL